MGLFDTIKLAGVEPTADGYTIDPHLPDEALLAAAAQRRRDAATPRRAARLRAARGRAAMRVSRPAGRRLVVYSRGRRVRFARAGDFVVFDLPVRAGRAANWAVVASR